MNLTIENPNAVVASTAFQDRIAVERQMNVMFLITSMPIGGAETLLVNLVRRLDRSRFSPQICCLKERGPLGEALAHEIPVHHRMTSHKFDFRVLGRLTKLLKREKIDAIVTVGAGDKMFWGRLAARRARLPVVLSALHSTGWPDGVGRLNRMLTRLTDGFIGVAEAHGNFLVHDEQFPLDKVFIIPNGIDTTRFTYNQQSREQLRNSLGIGNGDPVCGVVAALRPEKNLRLFIETAAKVAEQQPHAHFLIVGDGPERGSLESFARETGLQNRIHFLGATDDVPAALSCMDLFSLTSHNEANPVSILEAMSCQLPVVAPDVGSIAQSVDDGVTGFLVPGGDLKCFVDRWTKIMNDDNLSSRMGRAGRRKVIETGSVETMTRGYENLIAAIFSAKRNMRSVHSLLVRRNLGVRPMFGLATE